MIPFATWIKKEYDYPQNLLNYQKINSVLYINGSLIYTKKISGLLYFLFIFVL